MQPIVFCLHSSVILVDEGGCHINHPSLMGRGKLDQVLKINMAIFRYLNSPGVHHLKRVIRGIKARKMEAVVGKEAHEVRTVLAATTTTKIEQMLDTAATTNGKNGTNMEQMQQQMKQMLDTRCNNKWNKCNNKWNKWIRTNGHKFYNYPMQFSYTIYEQMAHVQLLLCNL